jgi:hypothetical protein
MSIPVGMFSGPPAITYATWNPADKAAAVALSGGNLIATITGQASMVRSTVGVSSASANNKPYWEVTINIDATADTSTGIAQASALLNNYSGQNAQSYGIFDGGGGYLFSGAVAGSGYLSYTNGDVLGFALDMVAGTLAMTKNNVAMGSGISGLSALTLYATFSIGTNISLNSCTANFGASPFAGTVPAGFFPGLY